MYNVYHDYESQAFLRFILWQNLTSLYYHSNLSHKFFKSWYLIERFVEISYVPLFLWCCYAFRKKSFTMLRIIMWHWMQRTIIACAIKITNYGRNARKENICIVNFTSHVPSWAILLIARVYLSARNFSFTLRLIKSQTKSQHEWDYTK